MNPRAIVEGIVRIEPRHFSGTLSPKRVCKAIKIPPARKDVMSWMVNIG